MRVLAVLVAITFCLLADDSPQGLPARPSASDYAAQAQWGHTTFAASLLPPKQVAHLFALDISRSYVVFEVACYADTASGVKIARDSFVVKVNASGDAARHAEAETVASSIQRQNEPRMPSRDTGIMTDVGVGVAHGTDPYTGRPVTNVYTGASVGVEQGGRRPTPQLDPDPKPGSTYEDRKTLEAQLRAHSLPDGAVDHAVAGYLFFRKSDLKTQGDTYALEYLADEDGSGATHAVTIAVPRKNH